MNHIDRIINAPSAEPGGGTGGTAPLPGGDRPGSPGWPPLPPPASPEEVRIERERLREIRAGLPAATESIDGAAQALVGLRVAEASFTSFTYSLAVAYNEVEAFTLRELKHRTEECVVIHDGVGHSADAWEAAERASAVRWV